MLHRDLYDEIVKLKSSRKLILVEGKKDKACLESLGCKLVVEIQRKPLYKVVEETSLLSKDVVILTDLDKTGKKLFSYLNSGLQNNGVRVDNHFRNFLFKHTKLRQIEGLQTYLNTYEKSRLLK